MLAAAYHIRLARGDELARLREIEDDAGALFTGLGLIDEAFDQSFPQDLLRELIELRRVWVACGEDDVAIGAVIASAREGAVYIEEIDVMREHGQRGVGGRLLEHVCAWAAGAGFAEVTLSTFRDLAWNGAFYRKHGFVEISPAGWTPGMHAIRAKEIAHGLEVEARVFMHRRLAAG